MRALMFFLLLLIGCSTGSKESYPQLDEFDKITSIRKSNSTKDLEKFFGIPEKIEDTPSTRLYSFPQKSNQRPIRVFVSKTTNKITTIALNYWVDFDAYEQLKQRFKGYRWIETSVSSNAVDVVEELKEVSLPEQGISFQYDNQDPLRRPMWIFFK